MLHIWMCSSPDRRRSVRGDWRSSRGRDETARRLSAAIVCAAIAPAIACGGDAGSSSSCQPGNQESCGCPRGDSGTRVCAAGARSWSECECETPSSSGGSSGGSSSVGAVGGTSGGLDAMTEGGAGNSGAAPECGSPSTDGSDNQVLVADTTHNYSFSSWFTLPPISVAPSPNLHFDWSEIRQDFLGHPINPAADTGMVVFNVWNLSVADFEAEIAQDGLDARDYRGLLDFYPGDSSPPATEADLSEFGFQGTPTDPASAEAIVREYLAVGTLNPDSTCYTVMLQSDPEFWGEGVHMIQAFTVDPNSTNERVNLTNTSTKLGYDADLQSLEPFYVSPGTSNLSVDWSDLSFNAMGRAIDPTSLDEIVIAKYEQGQEELEGELFVDLELIAAAWWSKRLEVDPTRGSPPTSVDLSTLETTPGSGEYFAGIDDSGTWLLALRCSGCRSPAPQFMTVLAPCTS